MSLERAILNRIRAKNCYLLCAVAMALWVSMLFVQPAAAEGGVRIPQVSTEYSTGIEQNLPVFDGQELSLLLSSQLALPQNTYTDDVVVDHNDTLTGDVVVLSGDVTVKEGGEIEGNLIVASGDIDIDSGGRVEGDVTNLSGDVEIAGKILGNLSVLSGDVELKRSGVVEGDVSVFSGELDQSDSAEIHGKLSMGPKVDFPFFDFLGEDVALDIKAEIAEGLEEAEREQVARPEQGPVGQFFALLFRLVGATVFTLVIGVGAGLLTRAKPEYVESVRLRLQRERAANFAVGLLFNMVLGFLAILFAITLCLLPMTLIAGGLLVVVNGVGWTAMAASVGRRLTGYTDTAMQSAASVVLGAMALTAPFTLLWATGGGCLRFVGVVAALIVASAGSGSVLAPWLKRLSSNSGPSAQLSG